MHLDLLMNIHDYKGISSLKLIWPVIKSNIWILENILKKHNARAHLFWILKMVFHISPKNISRCWIAIYTQLFIWGGICLREYMIMIAEKYRISIGQAWGITIHIKGVWCDSTWRCKCQIWPQNEIICKLTISCILCLSMSYSKTYILTTLL